MKERVVQLFDSIKPEPETTKQVKKNLVKGAKVAGIWVGYCVLVVVTVLGTAFAIDKGGEKLGLNKPIEFRQVK